QTSMNWENEVYDQNRVKANKSVPMSSWNFGRITSLNGGLPTIRSMSARQNPKQVRNWLTAKITGNIVEDQLGSTDITHWVAAAVMVRPKMTSPGPPIALAFASATSTPSRVVAACASFPHLLRK